MSAASFLLQSIDSRDYITRNTGILRDGLGNITVKPHFSLAHMPQGLSCLALIDVDGWRVSFEAMVDGFEILPPSAENLPGYCTITLPPSTSQHRQSTILRPGDCVRLNHEFSSTLRVEDVHVGSSIPPRNNEESFEVPETQQRLDHTTRRTQKAPAKRTTVQVEHSMQGSNTLRSATPAQTTQQSMIVAETPATHGKIQHMPMDAEDIPAPKIADPKDVVSTNVSTPNAINDSFAERPKTKAGDMHRTSSLALGSSMYSDQTVAQTGDEKGQDDDKTTTSEDESDNHGAATSANDEFLTAREVRRSGSETNDTRSRLKDTSMSPETSPDLQQAADVDGDNDYATSNRTSQRKTRRAVPEPQVRVPISRVTRKRASPANVEQLRTTKRKKVVDETETDDALASSIVVRLDCQDMSTGSDTPTYPQPVETVAENGVSTRSQASTDSTTNVMSPYRGKAPRVAFSNTKVIEREGSSSFLRKAGVQNVDKVTNACDIVCIGSTNGSLLKSAKLLLGLALSKTIVSDQWVLRSRQAGQLLDPTRFPPLNAPNEWDWGDDADSVSQVLNIDRSAMLKGKALFFTSALRKDLGSGFGDIEKIAKACGAKILAKSARDYKGAENNIILASDHQDYEAISLLNAGNTCYSKDLISMSVIRGSLDLDDDEYKLLVADDSQSRKGRKSAARKG